MLILLASLNNYPFEQKILAINYSFLGSHVFPETLKSTLKIKAWWKIKIAVTFVSKNTRLNCVSESITQNIFEEAIILSHELMNLITSCTQWPYAFNFLLKLVAIFYILNLLYIEFFCYVSQSPKVLFKSMKYFLVSFVTIQISVL